MEKQLETADPALNLLRAEERGALFHAARLPEHVETDAAALQRLLQTKDWWHTREIANALRVPLLRACAACLTQTTGPRVPPDPVARFHLGNGTRPERINWLANIAPRGISESYGLMVNYLYDPPTIEANHEAFVQGGIARSAQVEALLALSSTPTQGHRDPHAPGLSTTVQKS